MQSVLTWVFASVLYGVSYEIIKVRTKLNILIHIAVCFIITIATRLIYSHIMNETVNVLKTAAVTIPIFVGVYIALYLFMKHIGNIT